MEMINRMLVTRLVKGADKEDHTHAFKRVIIIILLGKKVSVKLNFT